jgi:hypothetical protein
VKAVLVAGLFEGNPGADMSAEPPDEQRRLDAATFIGLITHLEWQPDVWSDVGEIGIEWISSTKHAFVSIEGDGVLRYTYLQGDNFVSGQEELPPVSTLPGDLERYVSPP